MFLLSSKYIGYKQSYSYGKTTFIYIYISPKDKKV